VDKDEQIEQLQAQINLNRLLAAQPVNQIIRATFEQRLAELERQMVVLIQPE
jgi:hypothetical protein